MPTKRRESATQPALLPVKPLKAPGVVKLNADRTAVDLRTGRLYTPAQVKDIGCELLLTSQADLVRLRNDPRTDGLRAWISAVALRGIDTGDMLALDLLLNRLIGKVPDKLEHSGPEGSPIQTANQTILQLLRSPQGANIVEALETHVSSGLS